jgi:hypothetical protein
MDGGLVLDAVAEWLNSADVSRKLARLQVQ